MISQQRDEPQTFEIITTGGRQTFGERDGYVLPHEHIMCDLRVYWEGPGGWRDLDTFDQALGPATYDAHRRLPQGTSRENLVLADWYVAALELGDAKDNGCQLVVDLTIEGVGPQHRLSARSAEMAGLPLVVSVGRYLGHALTEEQVAAKAEDVAAGWLNQIEEGIEGLAVGIIGEIGTSAVIGPAEMVSLRAAAQTQVESGLPLNIHVDPFGRQGHNVLDVLEQEGADLSKVALSHCDADIDVDWLASLADRGAYVEFDLFGTGPEWRILGRGFNSDRQRLDALSRLVEQGLGERLLLSHDICMKNSLRRHGGWGYGHVGRTILPQIEHELGSDVQHLLSTLNPLRYLSV
jgi:phosphotriesterase-related protein